MADETKARPVVNVLVTPEQASARALAEEVAEQKKAGVQLDKTRPGGYFIGTDGKPHDAFGRKITEAEGDEPMATDEAMLRIKELEDERERLQALVRQNQTAAEAEAKEATTTESDEDDAAAKPKATRSRSRARAR